MQLDMTPFDFVQRKSSKATGIVRLSVINIYYYTE